MGDNPITVGVISDIWEGTYRDKRVSIEHLKVPLNNDQARKKVRVCDRKPLACVHSRTPVRIAVVHQTGSYVEKAKTPEYHPFRRDHDESVAGHLEVDAERNSDGFH